MDRKLFRAVLFFGILIAVMATASMTSVARSQQPSFSPIVGDADRTTNFPKLEQDTSARPVQQPPVVSSDPVAASFTQSNPAKALPPVVAAARQEKPSLKLQTNPSPAHSGIPPANDLRHAAPPFEQPSATQTDNFVPKNGFVPQPATEPKPQGSNTADTSRGRLNPNLFQQPERNTADESANPIPARVPISSPPKFSRSPSAPLKETNQESSILQTTFTQPASQAAPNNNRSKPTRRSPKSSVAKRLIKQLSPSDGQNVSGVPMKLIEVLEKGQGRANRNSLVGQYWEVHYDVAQKISADQHQRWVAAIPPSRPTDRNSIQVATANAANDAQFHAIQLVKSQAKLKQWMGLPANVIPADLPIVTSVRTNYEEFKRRGMIPPRLEGVNETLVQLHQLVVSRAKAAVMAQQNANEVKGFYSSGQTGVEHVLGAGRSWRAAEADFISSVLEYNKAYTDYAMHLPYGRGSNEQVVKMLVGKSKNPTSVLAKAANFGSRSPAARSSSSSAAALTGTTDLSPNYSTGGNGNNGSNRRSAGGLGPTNRPRRQASLPNPSSVPGNSNRSPVGSRFGNPNNRPPATGRPLPGSAASNFSGANRATSQATSGGGFKPSASGGAVDLSSRPTNQPPTRSRSQFGGGSTGGGFSAPSQSSGFNTSRTGSSPKPPAQGTGSSTSNRPPSSQFSPTGTPSKPSSGFSPNP